VRGRIAVNLAPVVSLRDDLAAPHHDCANRHVVVSEGETRFSERPAHPGDVIHRGAL